MKNSSDLSRFKKALQHNCDISDADGAEIFSICGMALRLRDLNKWENGIKPWQENNPEELVAWIDNKEQLWETLQGKDFSLLPLNGHLYDPFDTQAINLVLNPEGLYYGAGYAHSLKPTFFLARIDQSYSLDDISVIILKDELIRDLLTIPALNQDQTIVIRQDAAGLFLWDQMAYLKKSGQRYLHYALRKSPLKDTKISIRKEQFDTLLSIQKQTYIYHELGEIKDTVLDHDIFRQIVSAYPHTTVELITRTVKDLLADTCSHGPLEQIIQTKNAPGLGFYAAFQDGLFKPLFPDLRIAFEEFAATNNWEVISDAKSKGYMTAKQYARNIVNIFQNPKIKSMKKKFEIIDKKLVQPLISPSKSSF